MTEKQSNEFDESNGFENSDEFDGVPFKIETIRKNITVAAKKAGRKESDITLMAVTKTMPAAAIIKAFSCGITLFGENRVQELLDKLPLLDITGKSAHIIGHLQTNKVKYIADKVSMIESVDSVKLAGEIERQCEKAGRIMDILVEVNIGREDQKSGIMPEETESFIESLKQFKNIRVRGLMTVPPVCTKKEDVRPYFKQMYKLFIDNRAKKTDNNSMNPCFDTLSMGMSHDYDIAVEEGATIVRVGTGIFGKRNYNI